ncbi:MAG: energy transducer TonB [Rikenellaceae bacterium]|nr:energy transducer TonB [Rikenellaceae bacterium]
MIKIAIRILWLFLFHVSISSLYGQDKLDKHAKFLGKELAYFSQWVGDRLTYPEEEVQKKKGGVVMVSFVIDKNGKLGQIEILETPGEAFSKIVMQIFSSSPLWEPGYKDGEPINVFYKLPVHFNLPDEYSAPSTKNLYISPIKFSEFSLEVIGETFHEPTFKHQGFTSFKQWFRKKFFEDSGYPKYGRVTVEFEIGKNRKPENIKIVEAENHRLSMYTQILLGKSPKWQLPKGVDKNAVTKYRMEIEL